MSEIFDTSRPVTIFPSHHPWAVIRSVDHAAEIARLMTECVELRETLGKQIEARAIEIAKHQMALMHKRRRSLD
jgi:hypothetical protein